jgi:hypothetical protein
MTKARTPRTLLAVAALGSALLVALTATGGSAAGAPRADTTPPTVHLAPYARPLVGAQVFTGYDGDPAYLEYWQLDHVLTWQASDPSGICSQAVTWQSYEYLGSEEDPVLGGAVDTFSVPPTARRAVVPNLNAANWERVPDRFLVRVTDCAGNTATSAVALSELGVREDTDPAIDYQGHWRVSRFAGFSGGTTHATSAQGASASLTFTGSGPVALVMEKAADRGKADVYVDGVKKATVDTHATKTRHRVVVWQGIYLHGTHTLRVVNRATPGHPRIDLDTFLLCSGASGGDCIG